MTCKDLMTANPKCCLPEDSISRAAQIMREEDVGSIPVVSDHANRKVIGIVTDHNIAVKVVAAGWDPQAIYVGEVMLFADPVMCRVDDDYTKALQRMASQQVRRILVVNEDGSLAGIISQADIARRTSEEEVGEVVEEISEPAGFGHPLRSLGRDYSRHRYEEGAGFDANTLVMSAACLTVGAGIMFLLDPARRRTRRARLRRRSSQRLQRLDRLRSQGPA